MEKTYITSTCGPLKNYSTQLKRHVRNDNIDLIITAHKHHNKLYSSPFDTPDENIIDTVSIPVLILPKN